MASAYFIATSNTKGTQLYRLGNDESVTLWTANPGIGAGLDPSDLTEFSGAVWFAGETPADGSQLFKLGNDGSVRQWTNNEVDLNPSDLTVFNNALWFNGFNSVFLQNQLFKLGNDGSVFQWTALNTAGGGLNPTGLTDFNNALWFNGDTATQGAQLYKLGNDGSVTKWTATNPAGGGLDPTDLTQVTQFHQFSSNLWFNGATANGRQLFKLGYDDSVTQWTAIDPGGNGLDPLDITEFDGPLTDATTFSTAWFSGNTGGALGRQLYRLGFNGSVTQWTTISGLNPTADGNSSFTIFADALWFTGNAPGQGSQLYKLGFDGGVYKWTALNTAGGGLNPTDLFEFANALWFNGATANGRQLFKLGADGSVTQWTAVAGGLNPQLVSQAASDPDSTPSSIFENAAWLQGTGSATGTELYKLGADGSFTFWKDINPGASSSNPIDWARFG